MVDGELDSLRLLGEESKVQWRHALSVLNCEAGSVLQHTRRYLLCLFGIRGKILHENVHGRVTVLVRLVELMRDGIQWRRRATQGKPMSHVENLEGAFEVLISERDMNWRTET